MNNFILIYTWRRQMRYTQHITFILTMQAFESPPLQDPVTWVKLGLLGLLVGVCQAGGVGGGPIISPVMMFLFSMDSKYAIRNTFVMILGGSIGNFLKLGRERTSSGQQPLINYSLVMMTLPLLLSGVVFGVASGHFFPGIIDTTLLFIILVTIFIKTISLYRRFRDKEKKIQKSIIKIESQSVEIQFEQTKETNQDLDRIYEKEKRLFPLEQLAEIAFQVTVILTLTLLKGSDQNPSPLFAHCSWGYHLFNVLILFFGFFNIYRYKQKITKDEQRKTVCGYIFEEARLSAVFTKTVGISFIAGFLGGWAGLGGGVILTPMWLDLGVAQPRAAASATFCVLFTSLLSVVSVAIAGEYELQLFLVLLGISALGSYLVAGFLKQMARKFKRESLLILVLIGVISTGLLILPYQSIHHLLDLGKNAFVFKQFC